MEACQFGASLVVALSLGVAIVAAFAPDVLPCDTTVHSERRRASLSHTGTVNAILVASFGTAFAATCGLIAYGGFWTGASDEDDEDEDGQDYEGKRTQQRPRGAPGWSPLLPRLAAMFAWHLAVNDRTTDLQLVVLAALAVEGALRGFHPVAWVAILWAYVYTRTPASSTSTVATSVPLAIAIAADTLFHWRYSGGDAYSSVVQGAVFTPILTGAALVTAVARSLVS